MFQAEEAREEKQNAPNPDTRASLVKALPSTTLRAYVASLKPWKFTPNSHRREFRGTKINCGPEGRNRRGETRLRGPEVLGPLRGLGIRPLVSAIRGLGNPFPEAP